MLPNHFSLEILSVSIDVETPAFNSQAFDERVVSHPISHQRTHPRYPLGTVIICAGNANRLGD
jgi:hypothetical protein